MEEEEKFKKGRKLSLIVSVALHILFVTTVLTASILPVHEKEKVLKVRLASLPKQEQPKPQLPKPEQPKPEQPKQQPPKQQPPKPEPPKPQPPKPEPPKPEPPKPEPPKPEPPKPEPPKPEPPKPEPPKPKPEVKPLPMPKPVFKNKPEPAPAQPKPQPTTQPKPKSIAERLADGRQPVQPVQKPNNTRQNIDKFIQETLKSTQQLPSTQPSYSTDAAAIEVETRSYAEEVVRPYIQQNWREPSKGELDVRNPSSVEISFNVSAIGKITEARITRQSNSRVLNNSVQEFLRNMTRLSPLSAIGSKSASLTIIVTMNITN